MGLLEKAMGSRGGAGDQQTSMQKVQSKVLGKGTSIAQVANQTIMPHGLTQVEQVMRRAMGGDGQEEKGFLDKVMANLEQGMGSGLAARQVAEHLPKGSALATFGKAFGSAFDPTTGEFVPAALSDKELLKSLEMKRSNLETLFEGEPGSRPVDSLVEMLLKVAGRG